MNCPGPTSWLAYRLPACWSFSFVSWINQELGTLLLESACPPHLACVCCQAQNALCFFLLSAHTYITCPSPHVGSLGVGGDRVASSDLIHMTGDLEWGRFIQDSGILLLVALQRTLGSAVTFLDICPLSSTWRCFLGSATTGASPSLPENAPCFFSDYLSDSQISLPLFWAPTVSSSGNLCVFPNALWPSSNASDSTEQRTSF